MVAQRAGRANSRVRRSDAQKDGAGEGKDGGSRRGDYELLVTTSWF